jgi:hypothetical protein
MTKKQLIFLARKYNLEKVIRQELDYGLSVDEILDKYDL